MICYCIEDFIILQPRSRENTTYGVHEWGQKWNMFSFLLLLLRDRPTIKKMALPIFYIFFFVILKLIFYLFIFFFFFGSPKFIPSHKRTFLYYFIILLFFLTILLQTSKLNTVLNI